MLAPGCVPLFLTDGLKDYAHGIADPFWSVDAARTAPGQRPKTQAALDAAARAALRASGEVVPAPAHRGVKHRVVFGTQLAIEQVLAACGWTINTAFVERLNLDIRQRVAAMGRRVNTLCQGEAGLRDQLVLFQVYHNFVLPHASLRQPCCFRAPPTAMAQPRCGGRVPGDGGGIDRSRLVAQRGVALPGATVATAADGLRRDPVDDRGVEQLTCAQMEASGLDEG